MNSGHKVFLWTLGLLLALVAVVWAVGFFALGYSLADIPYAAVALGKAILLSPVAVFRWLRPDFAQGMAGGFVAMMLFAGWLGTVKSAELGLLLTGTGLVMFYPAFTIAHAPLSGGTWAAVGIYFGCWGIGLVAVVVIFAALTAFNSRFAR